MVDHLKPTLYHGQVDDCNLLFKSEAKNDLLLQYFTSQYHSIKFTCEKNLTIGLFYWISKLLKLQRLLILTCSFISVLYEFILILLFLYMEYTEQKAISKYLFCLDYGSVVYDQFFHICYVNQRKKGSMLEMVQSYSFF